MSEPLTETLRDYEIIVPFSTAKLRQKSNNAKIISQKKSAYDYFFCEIICIIIKRVLYLHCLKDRYEFIERFK